MRDCADCASRRAVVQPDVARAKINRARSWLDEADAILARPREEYLADAKGRDLAAAHWIADAGWEAPDEAAALFDLLADRGAITRITADSMRGAVGLRNRIAHGYARVEHRRIYNEASTGIRAMREFLSAMAREAGL
jgi:ribonuclease HepT-like protein